MTPEGKIKQYLRGKCESRGWYCLALESRSVKGWPDRTILIPSQQGTPLVAFIEVKAPDAKTNIEHMNRQLAVLEALRGKGFPAYLCDSRESVDNIIELIERRLRYEKRKKI